jgi:hypothetical protein
MQKIIEFKKKRNESFICYQCGQRRKVLGDVVAIDLEGEPSGIALEFCKACRVRSITFDVLEVAA